MDKTLYIAMNSAEQASIVQRNIANNLANINTTGFKADFKALLTQEFEEQMDDLKTRSFTELATSGYNFKSGSLNVTNQKLDVAIKGDGFFTVQMPNGQQVYTRAGNFSLKPDGTMITSEGNFVIGGGGPIVVPPGADEVSINASGEVIVKIGEQPAATVGKLGLVNPNIADLKKNEAGFFVMRNGGAAPVGEKIELVPGALEMSNVNMIGELTKSIENARNYERYMKVMKTLTDMSRDSARIMQMS